MYFSGLLVFLLLFRSFGLSVSHRQSTRLMQILLLVVDRLKTKVCVFFIFEWFMLLIVFLQKILNLSFEAFNKNWQLAI